MSMRLLFLLIIISIMLKTTFNYIHNYCTGKTKNRSAVHTAANM